MERNCTCLLLQDNVKYFMDGYRAMPSCPNSSYFEFPHDNQFIFTNPKSAIEYKCSYRRSIDALNALKVTEFSKGAISEVSWGETSGLYPASFDKFSPEKWDADKTKELLRARAAIHFISQKRNSHLRKAMPRINDSLEKKLTLFHLVENFPDVDVEIKDNINVKWFYLGSTKNAVHTGLNSSQKIVKVYGPFYNVGGSDAKIGDTYLIFYEAK